MSNNQSYDQSNNKAQFEKAGQQAAQVFGRFMSLATDIANEFNDSRHAGNEPEADSDVNRKERHNHNAEVLREAGVQLRKMREAAGYTLNSFSAALETEFEQQKKHCDEVTSKVEAAEAGREPLPRDWLNQVSALLSDSDPMHFFEKLQKSYETAGGVDEGSVHEGAGNDSTTEGSQSARVNRFSAIFQNDAELDQLTDAQFERLLGFVENSYHDAKKLVSD